MALKINKLLTFWKELKRRNVVRVITVYAAAAFVILELVSIIVEPLRLPEWTLPFIIVLLCVGFIIAVILSWIYDITPDGIEKTVETEKPIDEKPLESYRGKGWKISTYVSLLVIIALITFHLVSKNSEKGSRPELETSIAVLPFENWNSDEEYYYLGDAITDEIILQLWHSNAFDRVLSRSSTMQYKQTRPAVPAIALQLGVNYIIEGSIQRQKNNVSVRVQVIRAADEDHIWADEFTGEWQDIHTIQDNIALKVAEELKIALTPLQMEKIEEVPTYNLEAYDYYLLAEHLRSQKTPESLEKARLLFEKAIEADPRFIRAYTGLARCYGNLAFYGNTRPGEAYPLALKLARRALELDSLYGEAYDAIGAYELFYNYDFKAAEKNILRAMELDSNNLTIYKSLAELYFYKGEFQKAIEFDDRALQLHPFYPLEDGLYALHLYFANYPDSAISIIQEKIRRDTVCPICHLYLGVMYLLEYDYDKAITEIEKSLHGFSPFAVTQLGLTYSKAGHLDDTQRMLDTLETRADKEFVPYTMRGALMVELGNEKKALEYLRKGYKEREEYLLLILNVDTIAYSSIRSDPRFIEFYNTIRPGDK
ncbi:MAG: hypothetical protein RQ743_13555 [Bacteroidales bacterium]|nr:hypothetical protein [Bacteroidales bacterium]